MSETTATAHAEESFEITPLQKAMKDLRSLGSVCFRTFYYTARGKFERKQVLEQMYAVGNESLFFICVMMLFIGAIIAFQMGLQTRKVIPDMSLVGAMYLKILVREFAASVGAMALATRVGAGIAAQIGSMVVTDQTDALRMCAADPIEYLIVPRFIACVIMGLVVLLIGGVVAYFSGMVVTHMLYDVNFGTFINFSQTTWGDYVTGFLKCITFGGVIAIVSGERGLSTFGGSEGVGIATTEAVVGSLFGVILMNLVLGSIAYVLLPS